MRGHRRCSPDATSLRGSRRSRPALAPDGSTRWTTPVPIAGSPDASEAPELPYAYASFALGTDGTLYVWTGDLTALRPDGTVAWTKEIADSPGFPQGFPTFQLTVGADGTLYVVDAPAGADGSLIAIGPAGDVLWTTSLGGGVHPHASPSVGPDGRVYLVTVDDGGARSLEVFETSGTQSWSAPTGTANPNPDPTEAFDLPAIVSDTGVAYAPCGTDGTTATAFCAFGLDGEALATVTLDPGYIGMAITTDGADIYATTGAALAAFTAGGVPAWTTPAPAFASAILDGQGELYVGNQSTTAVTASGAFAWTANGGRPLAMAADGTLYGMSSGSDGANELVALSP